MSDLKLTAEEVAWVKAYVEARRTDASFCNDAAAKANAAARLAHAEPVAATVQPAMVCVALPQHKPGCMCSLCSAYTRAEHAPAEPVVKESLTTEPATTGETRTIGTAGESVNWKRNATVGNKSDREWWLRWTDDDGIYWFFHESTDWLIDPGQRTQPTYQTRGAAYHALETCPPPTALSHSPRCPCRQCAEAAIAADASRASTPPAAAPTLLEAARAVIDKSWYAHGAVCGSHWAYNSDTRNAFKAAIAREQASAREPNHGRTKWRQIARDWQARAESAERDLAACREQAKELTKERDATERHRLSIMRDRDAWCTLATAAEARVVAVEAEMDALKQDVIRQATDIEKMAAAPSPPLAAVRKALEAIKKGEFSHKAGCQFVGTPWNECPSCDPVEDLATEALRALDAATPLDAPALLTPERIAECKKICACVPFIAERAGVDETMQAMRDLIEAHEKLRATPAPAAPPAAAQVVEATATDDAQRVIDAAVRLRPFFGQTWEHYKPETNEFIAAVDALLAAKGEAAQGMPAIGGG